MASEQGLGGFRGVAVLLDRTWGEVDGAGEKKRCLEEKMNVGIAALLLIGLMCQGVRESSVLQAKIKTRKRLEPPSL